MGAAHTVAVGNTQTDPFLTRSLSLFLTRSLSASNTHTHTAVTADSSKAGRPHDQNRQYGIRDTNTE